MQAAGAAVGVGLFGAGVGVGWAGAGVGTGGDLAFVQAQILGRQLGIGAAIHHARQRLVQDPPERVRALGDGHGVQLRIDALAHQFDAALLHVRLGRLVVEQHQVDPLVLQVLDRMLDIRVRIQITRRHLFGVNQRILHEGLVHRAALHADALRGQLLGLGDRR